MGLSRGSGRANRKVSGWERWVDVQDGESLKSRKKEIIYRLFIE
jgi:hypothetical protein